MKNTSRRRRKRIRMPASLQGRIQLVKSLTSRINNIARHVGSNVHRSNDNQQRYALERLVNNRAKVLAMLQGQNAILHAQALGHIHTSQPQDYQPKEVSHVSSV